MLIYIHREQMLDDIERRYPAKRYLIVDDKLRIHAAMKKVWKQRVTTLFVRQGHYALDPANVAAYPPADLALERIGDIVHYDAGVFLFHETRDENGRRTA